MVLILLRGCGQPFWTFLLQLLLVEFMEYPNTRFFLLSITVLENIVEKKI